MATFTIKIDSEDLARDVLSHFGCLDEDDVPDLISDEEEGEEEDEDEELELTNKDVFEYLRSKGKTLEQACKADKELGDFFASFATEPEKRIEGDLEPAGDGIGTSLDDLANVELLPLATNHSIKMVQKDEENLEEFKAGLRRDCKAFSVDGDRFLFLKSKLESDSRVVRKGAEALIFEFIANRDEPYKTELIQSLTPHMLDKMNQIPTKILSKENGGV